MTHHNYDIAWSKLNTRLSRLEDRHGGLGSVLTELQRQQLRTGFIRDRLDHVERHMYYDPQNPSKFFLVQYNPKRAQRFNGAGKKAPLSGIKLANDGCYLCRDNIAWQQDEAQLGYEIQVGGKDYYAWMNPFPLFPLHVVIATADHVPQDCGFRAADRVKIDCLLRDFIELAVRMPEDVGYYNGVDAGASIPGHRHYQFFRRPPDIHEFPLERAAWDVKGASGEPGFVRHYPLHAAVWRGSADQVIRDACDWIYDWARRNEARLQTLTGNYIATKSGDAITFYFIVRDRARPRAQGMAGLIGGLEVLGELVFSTPEEKAMIDKGKINYFGIKEMLASVSTPFFM